MTRLYGYAHATFKDVELNVFDNSWELLKLMKQPEFMEFPCFTRDDIFDTALSLEFDNKEAFKYLNLSEKAGQVVHLKYLMSFICLLLFILWLRDVFIYFLVHTAPHFYWLMQS